MKKKVNEKRFRPTLKQYSDLEREFNSVMENNSLLYKEQQELKAKIDSFTRRFPNGAYAKILEKYECYISKDNIENLNNIWKDIGKRVEGTFLTRLIRVFKPTYKI